MPYLAPAQPCANPGAPADGPSHDALDLTAGGAKATIILNAQTYTLRITRQGKLILTK